jgi:hypothetical protein
MAIHSAQDKDNAVFLPVFSAVYAACEILIFNERLKTEEERVLFFLFCNQGFITHHLPCPGIIKNFIQVT